MRLTAMRYKTYTWPHNPRTYTIDYERKMAVHKVPFGGYQLQDLGLTRRIMRGEGEFVGEGAYQEFKKLASVFYDPGPGVLVHPGTGHFSDTIGNFLMEYYKNQGIEADFHPVHRLDKGTSGLLVVAKHPHAQERLKGQLHTAEFRRTYLAICLGSPPAEAGEVDAPIGMAEGSILARAVRPDGLPAKTRYQVLKRQGNRTLVRLELVTGRTHQVRVHMAYLGCPLAGDFLYGVEDPDLIGRPALHSWRLEVRQPVTGEQLTFQAALPEDMARLMA